MNKFIILIASFFLTSCASQPYSVIEFHTTSTLIKKDFPLQINGDGKGNKNIFSVHLRRIDGKDQYRENYQRANNNFIGSTPKLRRFNENKAIIEPGKHVLTLRTFSRDKRNNKRTFSYDFKPCIRYSIAGQALAESDWQPKIIREELMEGCELIVKGREDKREQKKGKG